MKKTPWLVFLAFGIAAASSGWARDNVEAVEELGAGEPRVRISPEFLVTFPQPLKLGAEVRLASHPRLRGYGDGGYFFLPISGGNGKFQEASFQVGVRYFQWNNGLFGLLGLGYRYLGVTTDVSAFKIDDEPLATSGEIRMHTLFLRVALGGEFRLSRRVVMGMDVGYQLPVLGAARMTLVDSNSGHSSNDSDLLAVNSGAIVRVARLGLPEVTLMRLTVQLD